MLFVELDDAKVVIYLLSPNLFAKTMLNNFVFQFVKMLYIKYLYK